MSKKQTPTFYIFHGEDDLSLEEAVEKLRSSMGENGDLNTSEFDGTSASAHEVINAVASFPFLSDKRLVIVKGMIEWITRRGAGETGKKAVETLSESLPNLPDYARLAFVERGTLSDNNALLKLAAKLPNSYVKAFSVPKDTTTWIIQRARSEYDTDIDPRAAVALSSVTGDDLRRADNELIKLTSFALNADGTPRTISEDDVVALTPYVAEANIYKMVDAIAEGRGQLALRLAHRLLQEKDNNVFSLFAMVTRQFRMLLLAREHLDNGGSPTDLARVLSVAPFVAQNVARQSRAFKVPDLERIYRRLQEYDADMKIGKIKPELALDLLVSSLSTG